MASKLPITTYSTIVTCGCARQAVLAVGKVNKSSDSGLTFIQLDVLSCDTSLADRGAKLDIGIVLEDLSADRGLSMYKAVVRDFV